MSIQNSSWQSSIPGDGIRAFTNEMSCIQDKKKRMAFGDWLMCKELCYCKFNILLVPRGLILLIQV
jgi:hypothetical protein